MKGLHFHTRNNAARHDPSYLEVAVLETLRDFPRYAEVDVTELATKVGELDAAGKISMKKVERAAATERSPLHRWRRHYSSRRRAVGVQAISRSRPARDQSVLCLQ
jgi:hypothetical protein